MTKKLLISLVALAALASPATAAELKYTMHMEAKAAANASNDPMSAMAGGMISQMFPPGGIDQMILAGDNGVRSEQKQTFGAMKAGMVVLIKPDGTQYVIDSASKTYWKSPMMPAEATAMLAQMNPKVTVGKRGVFETMNGMKCEHVTVNMTMALPGVNPGQLPPGMPSELSMSFDVWLSETIKLPPGAMTMSMGVLKQFGFDQLPEVKNLIGGGRMLVKGVLSMFGVEMVMETKDIKTEAAASELFEIPKDYKEVPAPGGRGGLMPAPIR